MNWIYAEVQSVTGRKLKSYKINPAYIIGIDLNNNTIIVKDIGILNYLTEDEPIILQLMGEKECSD